MAPTRNRRSLTLGEIRAAKLETWIGRIIIVSAAVAAAVSFWQVRWAASLIGIPDLATWGFPIVVDGIGTVLAGLTIFMHERPFRQRAYVWGFFLVFIVISLFCNALHAVVYVTTHPIALPAQLQGAQWVIVALLAAIPPVGSAIGMHAYAFTRRHGIAADVRATARETRTVTGAAHAAPRTPPGAPRNTPSVNVNAPQAPAEREPGTTAPVNGAVRPADVSAPPGRPDSVNPASWLRHWTGIADFQAGWVAYVALRNEDGDREPGPTDVQRRAAVSGDRSRVSRWMPMYRARWEAENDARPTVNGAVNGSPAVP